MSTHKFVIGWQKIPKSGKVSSYIQNKVFNAITQYMYRNSSENTKEWNATQWADPEKTLEYYGTEQEMINMHDKWANATVSDVNKFIESIKSSSVFRVIPIAIRRKLMKYRYNPVDTPYDHLVNTLMLFGINLYISIEKVKE